LFYGLALVLLTKTKVRSNAAGNYATLEPQQQLLLLNKLAIIVTTAAQIMS